MYITGGVDIYLYVRAILLARVSSVCLAVCVGFPYWRDGGVPAGELGGVPSLAKNLLISPPAGKIPQQTSPHQIFICPTK